MQLRRINVNRGLEPNFTSSKIKHATLLTLIEKNLHALQSIVYSRRNYINLKPPLNVLAMFYSTCLFFCFVMGSINNLCGV